VDAAKKYDLSPIQLSALRAFEPDKALLIKLVEHRFASHEQAASAVYQVIERALARDPMLPDSIELGGMVVPDDKGAWQVTLPVLGSQNSVETGLSSKLNPAGAVDYHIHPTRNSRGEVAVSGFGMGDLLVSLKTGAGGYVYQRGRVFHLEVGSEWAATPMNDRVLTYNRIHELQKTLNIVGLSEREHAAYMSVLRKEVAALPIRVTWYERSGADAAWGVAENVKPISVATYTTSGRMNLEVYPQSKLGQPLRSGFDLDSL
jgi:hypothetical protein